jgi:hypothetical protein
MTMNVEIYQISFEQYAQMTEGMEGREILLSAAKLASEIIIGKFGDEILAYIGLVPPTLVSDQAYMWMLTTSAGEAHPILLARYGAGVVDTALAKYRVLFGHCFEPKSAYWLRYMGAEFTSETQFEFRRK